MSKKLKSSIFKGKIQMENTEIKRERAVLAGLSAASMD